MQDLMQDPVTRNRVLREYRRLRAKDWRATEALRAAKISVAFEAAGGEICGADDRVEDDCLVKLTLEPECDLYDDSYVDGWTHLSEKQREKEKQEIREKIERDGHWTVFAYYRDSEGDWIQADNCGGFIGDEWKDSGYDTDLKRVALDALDADRQREADRLAERATFAALPGSAAYADEWARGVNEALKDGGVT